MFKPHICNACMLSGFSHVRLCDPMNCKPPGSSVHGISQARILEWVVMPSSRDLLDPRIKLKSLMFPALAGGFFTTSAAWKVLDLHCCSLQFFVGKKGTACPESVDNLTVLRWGVEWTACRTRSIKLHLGHFSHLHANHHVSLMTCEPLI